MWKNTVAGYGNRVNQRQTQFTFGETIMQTIWQVVYLLTIALLASLAFAGQSLAIINEGLWPPAAFLTAGLLTGAEILLLLWFVSLMPQDDEDDY